ncbi:RNA polymerase-binding protein [Saccharopolyspora shandongensis]|uniref:RNA polymerase-binding protein RbpA n=1 Tax=Saccharopolyspora shandongensis TaxID=418495 RepID=A0A1H3M2G2_9PSEU|nr:RNA polymerase-binding protein RbpA [Saccharopolyspora shandongensis]SDY70484.1 RNA polymerase-binding protein [Saccharopolyspora shandongensis]
MNLRDHGIEPSLSKASDQRAAPRRVVRYACPKNHEFEMQFSGDAEVPPAWECRMHGTESLCLDGGEPEQRIAKPPRTHWDMLLERRTLPQLENLLAERLTLLWKRRVNAR